MNTLSIVKNNVRTLTAGTAIATALLLSAPVFAQAAMLTRQLDIGATGSDVSSLQTFLASTPAYYPQGLVTGYFGSLTSAAVSKFQTANGIASVGRVGPITLNALNAQMGGTSAMGDVYAPIISNVNVNTNNSSATISWNTNEQAKGVVYYDTVPLTEYESVHSVAISGNAAMTDSALHTSHNVQLTNLRSGTKYFYDVYTTDAYGNVSMTFQSSFTTNN